MTTLGERVREARKLRGMTQEDLAEKVGVHVNTVIGIEKDTHRAFVETVESIAKALKCGVAELLRGRSERRTGT